MLRVEKLRKIMKTHNLDAFLVTSKPNIQYLCGFTGTTGKVLITKSLATSDAIYFSEKNIPVMVDDASGARLRTVVFNQPKACDLGADIAITSTDKLMPGPRGGLMAGREDLIDEIKVKVNQFGLEAQPPAVLAMLNGIKNFKPDNLLNSFEKCELS